MKRSLAGVALGAVLVLGGLTGCGGDDAKPTPSPTKSMPVLSASPSPSVGQRPTGPIDVDPPERPAAMDNADEAGAVAAAEYFLRLTGYAAASGSTTELEELSGADCEACKRMIETPTTFHDKGGWSEMPEITIDASHVKLVAEASQQYHVELGVVRGAYDYFTEEEGMVHMESEPATMGFVVTMRNSWEIDRIEALRLESDQSASEESDE